jgi:micrococcal nuclease
MILTQKKIHSILVAVISIIFSWFFYSSTNVQSLDAKQAKTASESQVIRVVDGDTIVVALNQKPETIRFIGMNTPETVAPNRPVQCYGPEASARTKELLTHKIVRLEKDPSQDDRDKYDRLLRYVFLDEENINLLLIQEGYAKEYTYKIPYQYQKEFREEQKNAKKNKVGLWGTCL